MRRFGAATDGILDSANATSCRLAPRAQQRRFGPLRHVEGLMRNPVEQHRNEAPARRPRPRLASKRSARAQWFGIVLAVSACQARGGLGPHEAPKRPSTPTQIGARFALSPEADIALQDMSVFHGDGERLAFARDGRVLYERLDRGRGLLRWTTTLGASARAELLSIADRLAEAWPPLPVRDGIPDEVSVTVIYRTGGKQLATAGVWEADLGKLPSDHPVREFRAIVKRVGASLSASGPGEPHAPEEAGEKWPHVLDAVRAR